MALSSSSPCSYYSPYNPNCHMPNGSSAGADGKSVISLYFADRSPNFESGTRGKEKADVRKGPEQSREERTPRFHRIHDANTNWTQKRTSKRPQNNKSALPLENLKLD
ncbi:hypothetical protein TWF788_005939 [Orbilia oligospora]|uniref:Uncharacterized protein n=1 Tax=Orbilia oligospora TaxID=2813651 RepID=A0A7C8TVI9_ORBOL|nr:hypothetical protein TWF788_005939 [Orbilia oligospora]